MQIKGNRVLALTLLLFTIAAVANSHAQTLSVLYNFGTRAFDPAGPGWIGSIAQGRDGNLYSTTEGGGTTNNGTVFRLTPDGKLNVMYNFCSQPSCADGTTPEGGLTLGYDGNFYGTTTNGGTNNGSIGTLFRITPSKVYTVLHVFGSISNDGDFPISAPTQGVGDTMYGATPHGGGSCGVIYAITLHGAYSVLYSFSGISPDGCNPEASPIVAADGNLYGTANIGGTSNNGVVYRLTPSGKETTIYSFDGIHGSEPWGPLVEGSDGNFYGTTLKGGTSNAGVIFEVTPTGTETVLHNFNGTTDGGFVYAGLVQATDGNFYGVAQQGGNTSSLCQGGPPSGTCGTLFQVTPTGAFSVIYDFDGTHGFSSLVAPFQHTNGLIYGDTSLGGTGKNCLGDRGMDLCGVFYQLDANLPGYVALSPYRGNVGRQVEFLGQGFTSATTVSFNGVLATPIIVSGTHLVTHVPSGATTGFVTVTTSSGTLTSNKQFIVTP